MSWGPFSRELRNIGAFSFAAWHWFLSSSSVWREDPSGCSPGHLRYGGGSSRLGKTSFRAEFFATNSWSMASSKMALPKKRACLTRRSAEREAFGYQEAR
jgi:hypothetical protein